MFPIIAADSTTLGLVVNDLRCYLRDSNGLNTLLCDSTENSDYNLELAIRLGLGEFNLVTPLTNYRLDNLPAMAYGFVIHEAVIEVLISSGILHSRNRLSYSTGGMSVADHDKDGYYQSWIQTLMGLRQIRMMEKQYKMQSNMESCYGRINSEFLSYSNTGWRLID